MHIVNYIFIKAVNEMDNLLLNFIDEFEGKDGIELKYTPNKERIYIKLDEDLYTTIVNTLLSMNTDFQFEAYRYGDVTLTQVMSTTDDVNTVYLLSLFKPENIWKNML